MVHKKYASNIVTNRRLVCRMIAIPKIILIVANTNCTDMFAFDIFVSVDFKIAKLHFENTNTIESSLLYKMQNYFIDSDMTELTTIRNSQFY